MDIDTRRTPLRIAIAGFGALGQRIARHVDDRPSLPWVLSAIGVRDARAALAATASLRRPPPVVALEQIADDADVVVECASASALAPIAHAALTQHRRLIVVSVAGLLTDPALEQSLRAAQGRVLIPSGAIGGLDAVQALALEGLEEATLVTRKPPLSFRGSGVDEADTQARLLFEGTAREAASRFPQNLNVAAAFALAGAGFDRTRVQIWIDPGVSENVHQIHARSAAGSFRGEMRACASPNPASSGVAADSVVALLIKLCDAGLRIGT